MTKRRLNLLAPVVVGLLATGLLSFPAKAETIVSLELRVNGFDVDGVIRPGDYGVVGDGVTPFNVEIWGKVFNNPYDGGGTGGINWFTASFLDSTGIGADSAIQPVEGWLIHGAVRSGSWNYDTKGDLFIESFLPPIAGSATMNALDSWDEIAFDVFKYSGARSPYVFGNPDMRHLLGGSDSDPLIGEPAMLITGNFTRNGEQCTLSLVPRLRGNQFLVYRYNPGGDEGLPVDRYGAKPDGFDLTGATLSFAPGPPPAIPEPGSVALLLSGLAAAAVVRRRR